MGAVVGVTLVKQFSYRGDAAEEFSNKYYFTGSVPADDAAWLLIWNALTAAEKTCYPSTVKIVAMYGYDSDDANAHAVFIRDVRSAPASQIPGTLAVGSMIQAPGDAAVMVKWKTSRLSASRNKPIYLRKYLHPAMHDSGAPDLVGAAQLTALNTYATTLGTTGIDGGRTLRSRTHSETLLSHAALAFITTHTLKRRGRRP